MPTFNGTTLICRLDPGVTTYDADVDIYLPWKDFLLAAFSNFGFAPAFDNVVGGDTTDAATGEAVDRQLFFRNDLGWRLQPPEEDIEITITGDLNPRDSLTPMFVRTDGPFSTQIRQRISSKARILEAGVSGLTPQESAMMLHTRDMLDADHSFNKATGMLHWFFRGTTIDIIPPKAVTGETSAGDVSTIE